MLRSCVAHPGSVKHTLESIKHGMVLEELIDQSSQRSGSGYADVRLGRYLVSRRFWCRGLRTEGRRQRQGGEILQQRRSECIRDNVLTMFWGAVFPIGW
jgi:hypothetical protein